MSPKWRFTGQLTRQVSLPDPDEAAQGWAFLNCIPRSARTRMHTRVCAHTELSPPAGLLRIKLTCALLFFVAVVGGGGCFVSVFILMILICWLTKDLVVSLLLNFPLYYLKMLFLSIKLRNSMSRIMLRTYQLYPLDFIFFSVHIKWGVRGKHGELEKRRAGLCLFRRLNWRYVIDLLLHRV